MSDVVNLVRMFTEASNGYCAHAFGIDVDIHITAQVVYVHNLTRELAGAGIDVNMLRPYP